MPIDMTHIAFKGNLLIVIFLNTIPIPDIYFYGFGKPLLEINFHTSGAGDLLSFQARLFYEATHLITNV